MYLTTLNLKELNLQDPSKHVAGTSYENWVTQIPSDYIEMLAANCSNYELRNKARDVLERHCDSESPLPVEIILSSDNQDHDGQPYSLAVRFDHEWCDSRATSQWPVLDALFGRKRWQNYLTELNEAYQA